jgi:hypothetical protein
MLTKKKQAVKDKRTWYKKMGNQIFPFGCPVGNHKKSLNLRPGYNQPLARRQNDHHYHVPQILYVVFPVWMGAGLVYIQD